MTVYKGNQKESKIYKGGTKIDKIYKGSQLVYQQGLPFYGFDGGNNYELLGSYDVNGIYFTRGSTTYYLSNINGNLGSSNSKIKVNNGTNEFTYDNTYIYNGIKVYVYIRYGGIASFYEGIYVLENSTIGSSVLEVVYPSYNGYHPTSVTNTSMTIGQNTYTRNTSKDGIWTVNGLV